MKSFFEEYGFVILAAIIVILLIVMATPIGTLIRSNISHIVESFGEKTTQKLDYAMREYQAKDIITLSGAYKKGDKYEDLSLVVMENLGNDKYLVLAPKESYSKGFNCSSFDASGSCVAGSGSDYSGSTIDKYLEEEYFNNLSDTVKNAIVETSISQDDYSSSRWQGNGIQYDYVYNNSTAIAENPKCKDTWCARKDSSSKWQYWKDYKTVSGKQESRSSRHRFHTATDPMSPARKTTDQSVLTDHQKKSADYMPASPDRAGRSLGSGWNPHSRVPPHSFDH